MKYVLILYCLLAGCTHSNSNISTFPVGYDTYPKFHGDIKTYLAEHIKYPEDAKAKNIQGTVYISFTIEKDGSVSHVKIIRGVYSSLDTEAVHVISFMPKWQPASFKGESESMQINLPVKFALSQSPPNGGGI